MRGNPSDRSVMFDAGGIADWLTGVGILVIALEPLAIPILAVTAVLAAPLVLIGGVAILAAAVKAR